MTRFLFAELSEHYLLLPRLLGRTALAGLGAIEKGSTFGRAQGCILLFLSGGEVTGATAFGADIVGASIPVQGVPEPGSASLIFGGMLTLLGLRRRR